MALSCWVFHVRRWSKNTPRYRVDGDGRTRKDGSCRGVELVALDGLRVKSIKANLENSKLELWVSAQLRAPPDRTIMLHSVACVSLKLDPMARYTISSTKATARSLGPLATSIRPELKIV